MELGEKLRQTRLELGLSQRQVCGDTITRNMLSRIENGQAKPSMKTLQYLASVLQKPVGYFLGEADAGLNRPVMDGAKEAFAQKKYSRALRLLGEYRGPDELYDWEMGLLGFLCCMEIAQTAIREGRLPVAAKLLTRSVEFTSPYIGKTLLEKREALRAAVGKKRDALPGLDEELMLRARLALEKGDFDRAGRLLEAVENRDPLWYTLRGTAELRQGAFSAAEKLLLLGDEKQSLPLLEECYRAQGDYEKAYFCACKRKE